MVQSDDLKLTIVAKRGDSVDIKCPIRSRPRSDITWFYQGKPITSSHMHRISTTGDKSTLSIRNFQPSQSSGIYQCYAQNEYGHRQANLIVLPGESENHEPSLINNKLQSRHDITSQEARKPTIIMGPQNTTIYEGQTVVLLCVTSETASGGVQINWLQNDLIIEPTLMRRFEINQLLGNLKIVSVQKSDAGVYKCIVSNEYGMSTSEAYVQVKTSGSNEKNSLNINKGGKSSSIMSASVATRPSIQQIGLDKILLKWQLVDTQTGLAIDPENLAYFKVDYKTTKSNSWLTIDEQIEPKKREYILTDLSKHDSYKFRVTTFFLNGDLNHGHSSVRFKLEPTWAQQQQLHSPSQSSDIKLNQIHMQITQIWPISGSSLGLRWQTYIPNTNLTDFYNKINGFYVFYRKIDPKFEHHSSNVPLFNYTRINIPISAISSPNNLNHQIIDTYIVANLDSSSHYELKMTCYNLNGDLCSFSNALNGLTQTETQSITEKNNNSPVVYLKSKQNEILFMILGIVLGILTLLLVIFIVMCIIRQRQHKRLLAQLHNTSQKLTSSSCPTLIYEDSLRNQNNQSSNNQRANSQHQNLTNYASNLFSNDSNSTNSQSMSTTASSITTPPIMGDSVTPSHVLMMNGNTVSLQPPLPPNLPPPSINPNSTLSRININMNPMNYIDNNNLKSNNPALSPNYLINNQAENYYHTLTTLGNLPGGFDDASLPNYAEYNSATLNIRNHLLKQQQIIMNTLKTMNMKQHVMGTQQCSSASLESSAKCGDNSMNMAPKSPSIGGPAPRRSASSSSKKSKKNVKTQDFHPQHILQLQQQQQQQQQQKNYYLMPNIRGQPQQSSFGQGQIPILNHYNGNSRLI